MSLQKKQLLMEELRQFYPEMSVAEAASILNSVPEELSDILVMLNVTRKALVTLVGPDGYEERKVDNTVLSNGLTVSTVINNDCGYETAIVDKKGVYPVERYPNQEHAEAGHKKWMNFCETNPKTVTMLSWFGNIPPAEEVTLIYDGERTCRTLKE